MAFMLHAKTRRHGNVILHEQTNNEPIVTWIFEEGTFKPTGKIVGEENYQIVTNYMGTPDTMYDSTGKEVWSCELNSYGAVRKIYGKKDDCPFRYQGQYEDTETGLYYNRFRYYSTDTGQYLSQDPIRLYGGISLYNYVFDTNFFVDVFGFAGIKGLVLSGRKSEETPKPATESDKVVVNGKVKSQAGKKNPVGKSAFDTPENLAKAQNKVKVYEIKSTELPEGLDVVADGKDVGGEIHGEGHHTIFPTRDMTEAEFQAKLDELEVEEIGTIDKNRKFCKKD